MPAARPAAEFPNRPAAAPADPFVSRPIARWPVSKRKRSPGHSGSVCSRFGQSALFSATRSAMAASSSSHGGSVIRRRAQEAHDLGARNGAGPCPAKRHPNDVTVDTVRLVLGHRPQGYGRLRGLLLSPCERQPARHAPAWTSTLALRARSSAVRRRLSERSPGEPRRIR